MKRKLRRQAQRVYGGFRRHSTSVIRGVPALMGRRFSYILDARRIYRVLPPRLRTQFWIIMFLQFLAALVVTASVYVTMLFIQSISSPESLRQGLIFRTIVPLLPDYWIFRLKGDRTLITAMCLMVVLFIVLKNCIVFVANTYATVFSERIGLFISREAYGRFLAKDFLWHVSDSAGQMVTRIDQRGNLTSMLMDILLIFGNILCGIVLCLALFLYNPAITSLVFAVFSVVGVTIYAVLRRRIDRAGTETGRITSKLNWSIRMITRGIREVVIYRKQETFLQAIDNTMQEKIPHQTFLVVSRNLPAWLLEVAGFVIIFAVMLYLVADGRPMPQTIGIMSMLLLTAWRVLPLFSRSMGHAVHIRSIRSRALSCLELLEGFDEPPEKAPPAADPDFRFNRQIELRDVSFRYPKNKADTLRSLSLTIEKGESVALIGKSGAGKSTVGMILAGLFTPMRGDMLVDGVSVTSGIIDSYRQLVGFVPQNPLLLPGTIANNVALAQWGETLDMEKIARVCAMAAMDFIVTGGKSLTFHIGDGGEGLSGGEAQRVSIARALYTDPSIVIFDEATSSLDRVSEKIIENTIASLRGRITAIVISHRMTTIERCDRVVWLENGAVKEVGTPEEILPRYTGG